MLEMALTIRKLHWQGHAEFKINHFCFEDRFEQKNKALKK